ncbi:hypothetical protein O4H61_18745 [Roseovarius aestuarii]|nr:hypothetical protein [Roseovarius aestuarii]
MSDIPQPNQSVVRISATLALVYSNASPETITKPSHDCFCHDHRKRSAKILTNERVMSDQPSDLLEAVPAFRLVCPNTGEVVGVEYYWNNGEAGILWRGDPIDNFVREPLQSAKPTDC